MRDDLNHACVEDCVSSAGSRKLKLTGGENAEHYTIVKRKGERRAGDKGDRKFFRRSSLELRPAKPTVLRVT